MDPAGQAALAAIQITSRTRAPSEIRAADNLPPFTQAQKDEFKELFPGGAAPAAPDTQDKQLPEGNGNDNEN
jgi:hypothetical protein